MTGRELMTIIWIYLLIGFNDVLNFVLFSASIIYNM